MHCTTSAGGRSNNQKIHIGGHENRLGRHYSRFSAFWSPAALTDQSLALRKSQNAGSNGRVGLGSAETRVPSHGWRRAPRKRHGVGRYRYRPDFQTATMAYPPSIAAVRHFTAAAHIAARRIDGDRLRPLRSAQAIAVHQDGIGGHGHPVERCRFLPGPSEIRRCAGRGER